MSNLITAKQFIDRTVGKLWDVDGVYRGQCVDIIKKYFPEVLGTPAIRNNAIDYWTNYPSSKLTRITNTPSFLPKRGDIMVWGTGVGKYGHIAIVDTANLSTFVSLDQNWPYSNGTTPAKKIKHSYRSVLGVLRPKRDVNFDQAAYEAQLRKEAEEAARIAAEKKAQADALAKLKEEEAKAEADRIAKEKAEAERKEQERIAAEQARLEEEARQKAKDEYSSWINIVIKLLEIINKWIKGDL